MLTLLRVGSSDLGTFGVLRRAIPFVDHGAPWRNNAKIFPYSSWSLSLSTGHLAALWRDVLKLWYQDGACVIMPVTS